MNRVGVFCGSSPGNDDTYLEGAQALGRACLRRGLGVVYGGAGVGLMGRLAETVIAGGGEIVGVIPSSLAEREVAHTDLPDLRVVGSMHERKALMAELSDAFVALPGGMGTIEEFFEMLTWSQLGIHEKACGLLNVSGYFDRLVDFLDHAAAQRFIRPDHRSMVHLHHDPDHLLNLLEDHRQPAVDKASWILEMSGKG